jgi:hypothetical protein
MSPRIPRIRDLGIGDVGLRSLGHTVTLYEDPGFGGRSLTLEVGEHRLPDDFNDVTASVQIAPGYVAWIYEHADEAGGYGLSVDLMEDCPDLTVYAISKQASYVSVFPATNESGLIWVRGKGSGDSYVAGHWERPRASGGPVNEPVGAVSPSIPSRAPKPQTTVQVSGTMFHITTLGPHDPAQASLWQHAVSNQLGVLDSSYRGAEPIGSAAVERASHNPAIPDFINFWYPQKQPRDQRAHPYFKRTCIGTAQDADITDVDATYKDQDLCIYITPDASYQYLISEGHPREYTDIMRAQYAAGVSGSGQASCDDEESIRDFSFVEAEIQPSADLASGVAEALRDRIAAAPDHKVGVYGPWIYDRGHCCHAEIHPAEEIWWRQDTASGPTYHLNVICDASERFWWRDQMDGDVKLKPWGAPPITGVFAIAFEVAPPGGPTVTSRLEFVVSDISSHNVAIKSDGTESHLFYSGTELVRFVPNGNALRASFEQVGLADNGLIRGLLVLETSVGTLSQTQVDGEFPAGTDVNAIHEDNERDVFDKQEGHYMFSVSQRKADMLEVHGPT